LHSVSTEGSSSQTSCKNPGLEGKKAAALKKSFKEVLLGAKTRNGEDPTIDGGKENETFARKDTIKWLV